MPFPVIEGSVTTEQIGQPLLATLPAGVQVGELLIIVFGNLILRRGVTAPAGWTLYNENLVNTGTWGFHKVADGTEGGTVEFAWGGAMEWFSCVALRISGVETGGFSFSTPTSYVVSSQNNPPDFTHPWDAADDVLWLPVLYWRDDSGTITSFDTDYSLVAASAGGGALNESNNTSVYSRSLATQTITPGVWNFSEVEGHISQMLAIRGLAAATPTLSLPTATGITATSAVPNVTVTF